MKWKCLFGHDWRIIKRHLARSYVRVEVRELECSRCKKEKAIVDDGYDIQDISIEYVRAMTRWNHEK